MLGEKGRESEGEKSPGEGKGGTLPPRWPVQEQPGHQQLVGKATASSLPCNRLRPTSVGETAAAGRELWEFN